MAQEGFVTRNFPQLHAATHHRSGCPTHESSESNTFAFIVMNTQDINKPRILTKTLHATLACMVASGALALDDRLDNRKPDTEPDPKTQDNPEVMERPDL